MTLVVETFGDKETEKIWQGQRTRFPADLLHRAISKLNLLDAATHLDTLRIPPSNRLEAHKGSRAAPHRTASASTTNGGSVSVGIQETPSKSKPPITTDRPPP